MTTEREKELEEKLAWYREKWEKTIQEDLKDNKQFLEATELMQRVIEENDQFAAANARMIKILQVYAFYDSMIIEHIKKAGKDYPLKEGPATIYLKEIGAYYDGPKGTN